MTQVPSPSPQARADAAGNGPADALPRSEHDVDAMFAQVRSLVAQVRQEHLRELLLGFLDDPELGPAFRRAPAAKGVHHAFLGGLCEHTLSVLQLGWRVCDHYPQLDRDLVTAGCLLHDLGKTAELSAEGSFEYTEPGRLVGHLVLTCQWIHERAARIDGFPRQLLFHLTHLVASHHGRLEYGSPKLPQTLEAVVVHALDDLDSRINSFGLLFAKDRSPGLWTESSRLYERPLFKGPSWNGEPLQPDGRRFSGPGLYEPEQQHPPLPDASQPSPGPTPVVPVPTPGPAPAVPAPTTSPTLAVPAPTPAAAARTRPLAAWERPAPHLREYAFEAPRREYAAPPPRREPPQPMVPPTPASRRKE